MLSFRGLEKGFGGQLVLDGVENDLHAGEVVLLRGDNGSGKTTLLNILTGNLEPDAGTIHLRPNGQEEIFRFPRKWWESLNPFDHFTPERVASEAVGRTWQDVRLFPSLTLSDNIAVAKQCQSGENPVRAMFPLLRADEDEASNRLASTALLSDLGLGGRASSSGDKVSLGQSKRVAIARAVRAGARVLFLDEPLSGLDAVGIEEVLGLLSSLARNERLTLVIVEHTFNIPRILAFANTVWTLRQGQIQVQTSAEVRTEYSTDTDGGTIALITKQLGDMFRREETSLYGGARLTRFFSKNLPCERPVLLEIRDLIVHRGSRLIIGNERSNGQIDGLSFSLYEGDIAILQAPNGWGKTTLLETIAGIQPAPREATKVCGRIVQDLDLWDVAKLGLYFLQSRNHSFPNLTVRESLALSDVSPTPPHLDHLLDRSVSKLSGGERQRLALASTLSNSRNRLGLLDEPFASLDNDALLHGELWNTITRSGTILITEPIRQPNETLKSA